MTKLVLFDIDGTLVLTGRAGIRAMNRACEEVLGHAGALDTTAARPGRRARSGGRRGHIPFDPAAKKMLELALRESIRFSSKGIDTGHLLLAAARTDGTTAQRALAWFGHDRRAVEAAVVATWAEGVPE